MTADGTQWSGWRGACCRGRRSHSGTVATARLMAVGAPATPDSRRDGATVPLTFPGGRRRERGAGGALGRRRSRTATTRHADAAARGIRQHNRRSDFLGRKPTTPRGRKTLPQRPQKRIARELGRRRSPRLPIYQKAKPSDPLKAGRGWGILNPTLSARPPHRSHAHQPALERSARVCGCG